MAIRYVIEVVADDEQQAAEAEHLIRCLPAAGIFTSAVSVADTATGKADEAERKYPLNTQLVTAYAYARKVGE